MQSFSHLTQLLLRKILLGIIVTALLCNYVVLLMAETDLGPEQIKLTAQLINIRNVYTISVLAQNPSYQRVHIMLGDGLQTDYYIENLQTHARRAWSDTGSIFSFTHLFLAFTGFLIVLFSEYKTSNSPES